MTKVGKKKQCAISFEMLVCRKFFKFLYFAAIFGFFKPFLSLGNLGKWSVVKKLAF